MQILNISLALFVTVITSACVSDRHVGTVKPEWIDNPGNGVSASAGMHIRGRVAQEELATLRGRDEFAKRFGVNIQSAQITSTTVANDRSSTVGTQITHEDTNQTAIKAMVKEKWRDPDSDVLWVWIVPSDQ